MKVCMLVSNPVTDDPRVRREARTLATSGYEVVIVGLTRQDTRSEEWLDGCQIVRLRHPRALGTWLLRRLGLYSLARRVRARLVGEPSAAWRYGLSPSSWRSAFLFQLGADLLTVMSGLWINVALARESVKHRADVYHAHDLDTLLAGYLAKRKTGKPLVYDYHELYTEQFERGQKTALWRHWYATLEWLLVKRTDLKLTVCDSLGDWIAQRYGTTPSVTIMNAPLYQAPAVVAMPKTERIVLYQGLYVRNRGLEQLIESARYLRGSRIVLRGYGDWEPRLRTLVRDLQLHDRVTFAEPVPMTDLVRVASQADIGVAPFIPVCLNTRLCLPNKLFEYMMAGLAIVASDLPEMRRVILEHQLGTVFNPEDPAAVAESINALVTDPERLARAKANARRWAERRYNWEHEERRLLSAYRSRFGEPLGRNGSGSATVRRQPGRRVGLPVEA